LHADASGPSVSASYRDALELTVDVHFAPRRSACHELVTVLTHETEGNSCEICYQVMQERNNKQIWSLYSHKTFCDLGKLDEPPVLI
jgi:hypothetical protein